MEINLPIEFKNRMKNMLGEEYEDFLKAYEEANFQGLRINALKTKAGEEGKATLDFLKEAFELRQVPWCKTGFYYNPEKKPGREAFHHAGAYYIQEPSAMLVGELAAPQEKMKVLDLCGAPGGKTGHLAGLMKDSGVLVANEIVPNRCKILSQNVERMGIKNCIVINENPVNLAKKLPSYFDMVVVDVPCSGEGMFRKDETAINEWSPENVEMCGVRGQEILDAADSMLAYGGKLVYSTCTFAPIEDEGAILNFLKSHPLYKIEKTELIPVEGSEKSDGWMSKGEEAWGLECVISESEKAREINEANAGDLQYTYRLWPHKLHGEGHFVAVLRKGSIAVNEKSDREAVQKGLNKANKSGKIIAGRELESAIKLYMEFSGKNLKIDLKGSFHLFGDNLYIMPEDAPDIKGIKVERAGLQLGEIKKNRFEPAHALAMALKPEECAVAYETDEPVKYLCGEVISCDSQISGWCLVTFYGYPLGWGKASGGRLKNHYPKGLRIKM